MGGPSAAIVLRELAELGVRRVIRVGTCGALDAELGHGDLVVVGRSIAEDGASQAMGAEDSAEPDPELTAALARSLSAGTEPAVIVSTDLFYDGERVESEAARADRWRSRGAVAIEMEAATLFTLGRRIGVAVACVLAVTDTFAGGERQRMDDEAIVHAAKEMGTAAAAALAEPQP
jgi:uridine phosphorylase